MIESLPSIFDTVGLYLAFAGVFAFLWDIRRNITANTVKIEENALEIKELKSEMKSCPQHNPKVMS